MELQFDGEEFQQNSLLRFYIMWRKIFIFHCEIPPNCSGNTRPWRHILDSPSNFAPSCCTESLHGLFQFTSYTLHSHSQLQDKLHATPRHMEGLPYVYSHAFTASALRLYGIVSQDSIYVVCSMQMQQKWNRFHTRFHIVMC